MVLYDGIDYRYSSDDPERAEGVEIISNILGFHPAEDGLHYSLNFYSGGTGIDNRLAIRCRLDTAMWRDVISKLSLRPLSEALADPGWSESFLWLVRGEDTEQDATDACFEFINSSKHGFQDVADVNSEFLFTDESDVNTWCVVWVSNGWLNYIYFEQG